MAIVKEKIKTVKKVISQIEEKTFLEGDVYRLRIKHENGDTDYLYLNNGPTGNCQFGSIVAFQALLEFKCDSRDELLKKIVLIIDKPMFLIDVREEVLKSTLDLIDNCGFEIKFQNKYTSTNSSIMNIIMVDASDHHLEFGD